MGGVELERDGAIATVTMRAGDGRNGLSAAVLAQLCEAVTAADAAPETRAIVLRSAEPVFSVGGDIAMFAEAGDGAHDLLLELGASVNPAARLLHETEKVTIAAVHGAVAGGAIGFMAACDLVVAAEGTTFALGYGQLGTTPDAGASWFLARDIGYRRALELYLTNERFDATRAWELGLVNRVVAPDELDAAALSLAMTVAQGPARATREAKRLFRSATWSQLAEHLDDEIRTFAANTREADFAEGVRAFQEKRRPNFGDQRVR